MSGVVPGEQRINITWLQILNGIRHRNKEAIRDAVFSTVKPEYQSTFQPAALSTFVGYYISDALEHSPDCFFHKARDEKHAIRFFLTESFDFIDKSILAKWLKHDLDKWQHRYVFEEDLKELVNKHASSMVIDVEYPSCAVPDCAKANDDCTSHSL